MTGIVEWAFIKDNFLCAKVYGDKSIRVTTSVRPNKKGVQIRYDYFHLDEHNVIKSAPKGWSKLRGYTVTGMEA